MSAANLDEIKKKYNFKDISVATWRNPALSVLPARGGPNSPGLSADGAYIPSYRVNYDLLSHQADDEQDIQNDDDEVQSDTEVLSDLNLDESFENPPTEDSVIDDFATDLHPADDNIQVVAESDADQLEFNGGLENSLDSSILGEETIMAGDQNDETSLDKDLHQADNDAPGDAIQIDGSGVPEAEPFVFGAAGAKTPSDSGSEERKVSFAPGTSEPKNAPRKKKVAKGTKGKKNRFSVPLASLPKGVISEAETAYPGESAAPPPVSEPPTDANVEPVDMLEESTHTDELIKTDVDEQGESAKANSLSEEVSSADALEDSKSTEELSNGDVGNSEEATKEDSPSEAHIDITPLDGEEAIESVEGKTADNADKNASENMGGESLPDPVPPPNAATDQPPQEASAFNTINAEPTSIEKPSKKKASKSSKDKDKAKKKSSKNKTRDASPQPAGLGIELPPPANPEVAEKMEEIPSLPGEDEVQRSPDLEMQNPKHKADAETGNEATSSAEDPAAQNTPSQDAGAGDPEPSASDPPAAEQADISEDHEKDTDTTTIETAHNDGTHESGDGSEPAAEHGDAASNVSENLSGNADQLETEANTPGHEPDSKDAAMEIASSPADSGVELENIGEQGTEAPSEEQAGETPATEEPASEPGEQPDDPDHDNDDNSGTSAESAVVDAASEEPTVNEPKESPIEEKADAPSTHEEEAGEEHEALVDNEPEDAPKDEPDPSLAADAATLESKETNEEVHVEITVEEQAEGDETNAGEENEAASAEAKDHSENVDEEAKVAVEESSANLLTVDEANYEPPSAESVQDETKTDPFEATKDAAVPDEVLEAPVSPKLSKTSSKGSHKHKADHWERKHEDKPFKGAFEDNIVLERHHSNGKNGKDGVHVKTRSPKSRRHSLPGEDEERRKRRAARRLEEESRRAEEERRRAEDEERRRIRRAAEEKIMAEEEERRRARRAAEERRLAEDQERRRARRAARAAAAERTIPAEGEVAVKKDELMRRRHRERDDDKVEARPSREKKLPTFTLPPLPKALSLTSGESVHGTTVVRAQGGAYRPVREVSKTSAAQAKHEVESKEVEKEVEKEPSRESQQRSPTSSSGEKPHHRHRHHHHHHHHRPEGERSDRSHEHRARRPSAEERGAERPRSFLGGLGLARI